MPHLTPEGNGGVVTADGKGAAAGLPGRSGNSADDVFSMDGYVAPLAEICDLADRYDAIVMVDDS
ncbi:hypothetical protein AB0D13_34110, partial [Streptomyces sp. NPDC048430]